MTEVCLNHAEKKKMMPFAVNDRTGCELLDLEQLKLFFFMIRDF